MTALYISVLVVALYYVNSVLTQTTTTQLQNGRIITNSIAPGAYNYYYFSLSATNQLFGKRAIPSIYLSSTTCSQPLPSATVHDVIPAPYIFISTSKNNPLPGPDNGIAVDEALHGLSTWKSDGTATEIWIAVGASTLPSTWTGNWTYEIGVSTVGKRIM